MNQLNYIRNGDYKIPNLQLTEQEEAALSLVCSKFSKVAVILNTAAPMELGIIDTLPQVKAILHVPCPGATGFRALGAKASHGRKSLRFAGELKGARFSVPEKMDYVLERVRIDKQVSFTELFAPDAPKGEIIVTFLALLELLRQHRLVIYQNAAFHEITILPSTEIEDDRPLERPDDYE